MANGPDIPGGRAAARAGKGLGPNDIDPDDMDNIAMRMFDQLTVQVSQLESIKKEAPKAPERASNARTLGQLEHILERLVKLEAELVTARKSRAAAIDAQSIKALETRIDRVLAVASKRWSLEMAERGSSEPSGSDVEIQGTSGSAST